MLNPHVGGTYSLVAVRSSGILKAKQTLGVTFNFDKKRRRSFYEIFKNDYALRTNS